MRYLQVTPSPPLLKPHIHLKLSTDVSATGSAGGDLVQIKLSGNLMILSLKIDPSLLEAKDAKMLEDLIIAAHDNAKDKINDIMKVRLAPLAAQIRDL